MNDRVATGKHVGLLLNVGEAQVIRWYHLVQPPASNATPLG